jgi:flagellar hook-associated protein 1
MTDLISIGAAGVKVYTSALATIGDNIANAQTPGFARRTTRIEESPAGGDVVLFRNQIRPGGALATGVTRAVDGWLVDDARVAEGEAGRTSARLTWLDSAEQAITDGGAGVGEGLTGLFNAADRLSANPSDRTLRSGFLQAADDAAAAFRRTSDGLLRTANAISADARSSVDQLNTDLAALERVNAGLRRARDGSTNQASLLDERDRLIDGVSAKVAVTVGFDNRGAATLRLAPPSGEPLVEAGRIQKMMAVQTGNGAITFALVGGASLVPTSGRLAGLADAARDVAGRQSALDRLATQFGTELNLSHQSGRDAAGNSGRPLFDTSGATAASLRALGLEPEQVAAADGSTRNGNLLSMAGLRGASGTEAGWADFAASQAQATAAARAQDAAAASRRDGAQSARADVSAVDLDQEAGELLRFQQAYQGAARVLQVARETMQSILNAL